MFGQSGSVKIVDVGFIGTMPCVVGSPEALPSRWAEQLHEVDRQIRRWLPSFSSMPLFTTDYRSLEARVSELQQAAARLEAAMTMYRSTKDQVAAEAVECELCAVDLAAKKFDTFARETAYAEISIRAPQI